MFGKLRHPYWNYQKYGHRLLYIGTRRFIGRPGNIRTIRCDNGSNFVGEERELAKCWKEVNQKKVGEFMLQSSADWIQWKRNPPLASHMGGVWERQIRSARNILSSLMKTHGASLDEESLNTLFVEVKGIVNSRPLVVETINDVNSQAPLSPSHILNMKLKLVMPPAGKFRTPDLYCRKRWRRVQHISSKFWSRWRKEFLATLQDRQKWKAPLRNFLIGDIVILKEDTQHNDWRQGLWANSSVVLQMFKLHCCLTQMKRFDPWQRSYQNIQ